jgi:hypothetical protein
MSSHVPSADMNSYVHCLVRRNETAAFSQTRLTFTRSVGTEMLARSVTVDTESGSIRSGSGFGSCSDPTAVGQGQVKNEDFKYT